MSAPVFGSVGAELYDALAPLAGDDAANGYALGHVCQAIGLMRQLVADLSEDQGDRPGWTGLVDVETSPAVALPWLAQIPGVKLTTGASEDAQRNEIRIRAGQARGRPASTLAKVKVVLSGTQSVRLVERISSAWTYAVVVRRGEVPETDLPSVNRLPNPGPVADITGWTGAASIFNTSGAFVVWDSTPTPFIGPGLVHVQTDGASTHEGATAALLGTFQAGHAYTAAMYVRGGSGGETIQLLLGAATDSATSSVITLTAGWSRYSVTWVPTADRTSVVFAVRSASATATDFFLNAGIADASATAVAYNNGDSPGWSWDGTPHNSSSHRIVTTIVYDAALGDKPGGTLMTVVISDDPLIADITRSISGLTETIDSFTLGGVT